MSSAQARRVSVPGGSIAAAVRGDGPLVVMLPGCGRPATDLDPLADALVAEGYQTASLDYRSAGQSTGRYETPSLSAIAADISAVIDDLGGAPAVIVGHAFGNRVARQLASQSPKQVRAVILLAAGGKIPPIASQTVVWGHIMQSPRDLPARLDAIADAFFAPDSDPRAWLDWELASVLPLIEASAVSPLEDWWTGGRAPMLVVQGALDRTAPVANGEALAREAPGRVTLVSIDGAGHALLPERPAEVIAAVRDWLRDPPTPAPASRASRPGLLMGDVFLRYLDGRSAAVNAGFLLPHLEPGMRLLDCGCGTGSITRGLAAAVSPGRVVGVDIDAAVLDIARRKAAEQAPPIEWVEGAIESLPFPDESFDVVFAHTVLMHTADPHAAVRECARVLRPGGLLAVVDGDWGADLMHPTLPALLATLDGIRESVQKGGADPFFGRRHRGVLSSAGFEVISVSMLDELAADPRSAAEFAEGQIALIEAAVKQGDVPPLHGHLAISGWRSWAAHPAAFFCRSRIQTIGRRPPPPVGAPAASAR